MKENSKSSINSEFDGFSEAYTTYMDHPLRNFASGKDDNIFPEHKSDYIVRLIKQIFKNKTHLSFLDFGCGNGSLLRSLLKRIQLVLENWKVNLHGVDISSGMIREAKELWQDQKEKARFDTLFEGKTPYESESFNMIIASSVFHHIDPPQRSDVLKEIFRILKPGGYFLMIEHNPINPITNYIVRRTPMDKNAILLNPFEAKTSIQNNGFKNMRTDYILFFPPKIRSLWTVERYIKWLIFGAQYVSINSKPY